MASARPVGTPVRCSVCRSELGAAQLNAPRVGRSCPFCKVGTVLERRVVVCEACGTAHPAPEDEGGPSTE